MINHCYLNHMPLDFISTHCYGVNQGYLDADGETGTIINPGPDAIYAEIKNTRRLISVSPMPNLELHYTEWSASYTPTDYIHDTYFEAS
jgi:xylan 1,4-beta-xylosidase